MLRYLSKFIKKDLKKKMVFLGGPRQVGKTTMSKTLLAKSSEYFNWDNDEQKKAILTKRWRKDSALVILDELHKYPRWKSWLKGIWDVRISDQTFLVTGSARLDVYQKSGDSLLGRYHYWRLHPFTLDEHPSELSATETYERLLKVGGFPEPFLNGDEREARRWRRERFRRILQEDVRDISAVQQLQSLDLFVNLLRERVGGLVVLSNLAQDLQVSANTTKHWLQVIERLYLAFAIYPYTTNIPRSIQKPAKVYFYDNADVIGDEGVRLENLVATHLLKRLQFIEDYYGYDCELHYIRDKDGREVDFVTVIDQKIDELIEVKLSDEEPSTALKYYQRKLKPKRAVQIVGNLERSFDQHEIHVTSPIEYFAKGPWEIEIE
jgi:predicted AAA+ superfamily ATPase